jgi:hypothetical protein
MIGMLRLSAAFYCLGRRKVAPMGSLIDELERREAAARAEAEQLRGQIAEPAGCLAQAEERLSRLVITRETVEEVLSAAVEPSPGAAAAAEPELTAPPRYRSPVIGVMMVPPWRAGLEVSVLPHEYRDLLEVAEDAGRPLRAGQIAAAAGLPRGQGEGGDVAVEAQASGGAGLAGRGRRVVRAARARRQRGRSSGKTGVRRGSSS